MSRWGKGQNRVLAAERALLNAQVEQAQRGRVRRVAEQRTKRAGEAMPAEGKRDVAPPVRQAAAEAAAKSKEGLREERLSLLYRYMKDASIGAPAAKARPDDPATSRVASAPAPEFPRTGAPRGVLGSTFEPVVTPSEPDETATAEAEAHPHPAEADGAAGELDPATSAPLTVQPTTAGPGPHFPVDAADWPAELVRLHEALALSVAIAFYEHAAAAANGGTQTAAPEECEAEPALPQPDEGWEEPLRLAAPSRAAGAGPANLPWRLQPSLRATGLETNPLPIAPGVASTKADLCQIQLWRGYLASTFYVRVGEEVLESRSFRWRGAGTPPDTAHPRAAYEELVSRLAARGWQAAARGPYWFATEFSRPRAPR
jgi:hypothetical protein